MPYKCSALAKRDAIGLLACSVEKTQINPGSAFRKDGEVSALAGHSGAKRIGATRKKRIFHVLLDARSWRQMRDEIKITTQSKLWQTSFAVTNKYQSASKESTPCMRSKDRGGILATPTAHIAPPALQSTTWI
jgi:hypothetical protein